MKRHPILWPLLALLLLGATSPAVNVPITITGIGGGEEFVGPFASWMCAASSASGKCGAAAAQFCNADSTGASNATSAVQACINSLSSTTPVIYFPCGTYNLSDVSTTATASSGASSITVASGAGIVAGMAVYGAGIAGGSIVTSAYTPGSTSVPLQHVTTGTLSVTPVKFGPSVSAQMAIGLIGQDNSTATGRCTTSLKWTGSSGGTLLNINGVSYSHFDRLTFDGNSLANVLVDQAYDNATGVFDTSNRYIDGVFKNGNDNTTSYGFRCGFLGYGCSETSLVRNTFSNLGFGVATCNANALDVMVWYSSFSNMRVAVGGDSYIYLSNGCGGGAFHVIGSVFSGSSTHDVGAGGAGDGANVIDSYSSGSNQFNCCFGFIGLQRNTVINTSIAAGASIAIGNHGLLLDNTVQNTSSANPYVSGGLVVSIGNKYTTSSPFASSGTIYTNGGGDQTIAFSPPSPPALPGTLPNNGRTIYEAGSLGVQGAICKASNGAASTFSAGACTGTPDGLKNVAHLAAGTYSISATIAIPANSNAQVLGDGWDTVLSSTTANPVILVNGPSAITLRGFHISGNTTTPAGDAIHISGVDQAGAYVYMRHTRFTYNSNAGVVSSLSNALVEADAFEAIFGTANYDVILSGGGHFNQFFGTGERYSLSGSASAQLIGGWLESGGFNVESDLTGSGSFVHSTAFIGFPPANNLFVPNNFTGTLALLNSVTTPNSCTGYTGYAVNATGTGGGLIISALNQFQRVDPISNGAGDTLKFLGNNQTGCVSNANMADSPSPISSADLGTVASALGYFRSTKPMIPAGNPIGVSAVAMYDILTEGFVTGEQIAP